MKKITLLAITLVLFYSCNNKDKGAVNYPIDADLKAAFNYQVGTYWIYRDSISGRVDSFAVRSNIFTPGSQTTPTDGNYTLDGIRINITEYISESATDTSGWAVIFSINEEELIWFSNINYFGQAYFNFSPIFTYPFQIGQLDLIDGQTSDDNPITTNIYANYALNGQNFLNVAEINETYTEKNLNIVDWFYVSTDIGYVKIRINDPYDSIYKVWEIQRWNIVK